MVEILDMKFSEGKVSTTTFLGYKSVPVQMTTTCIFSLQKYFIRTAGGTTRWISRRQLNHAPHLIVAFQERQQRTLSNILDSGRQPGRLCGLVTDPLTGRLQFLTKWHGRDECHLVMADQMYDKHPQMAIRYLLGLVRVREFEPSDVSRVAERLDAIDADTAAPTGGQIWTAFDSSRVAQEILGESFINPDQSGCI